MITIDSGAIQSGVTQYAQQGLTLVQTHPAYLIPAIIILALIIKAFFSAVRTAMMVLIVVAISGALAGADVMGWFHHAAPNITPAVDAATSVIKSNLQKVHMP